MRLHERNFGIFSPATSFGNSRRTGRGLFCCARRKASRTVEGIVAGRRSARYLRQRRHGRDDIYVLEALRPRSSIPFWQVIMTIGIAPSNAKAAPVVRFSALVEELQGDAGPTSNRPSWPP